METILVEWLNLVLRWLHVIAGMAWIGASFYFMHIDAHLRAADGIPEGKGGEAWEVHGGGFYQVRKYLVAPAKLPEHLIWHKWQSYTTWISGFLLLVWLYYLQSDLFLIDPAIRAIGPWTAAAIGIGGLVGGWVVYDSLCRSPLAKNDAALLAVLFVFVIAVAYGFQQVFSGRGALLHTGALMATMMSGNVAMLIIPNQKKVIASLLAGAAPDPALGKAAKQRSSHNNYLTLPVVFLMLANHYPLTYQNPFAYLMVGLILIAGALIRYFYNARHAGHGDKWWAWGVSAAALVGAIALSVLGSPAGRDAYSLTPLPAKVYAANVPQAQPEIVEIIQGKCSMCHAEYPSWPGIGIAPKGVLLDTPEAIEANRREIARLATFTHAMPPNNITELTAEERLTLTAWIAGKSWPE